jgi:hypothetical protein
MPRRQPQLGLSLISQSRHTNPKNTHVDEAVAVQLPEEGGRRPELKELPAGAIFAGFLVTSYRSRYWGPMLSLWISSIETEQPRLEIATAYSDESSARDRSLPLPTAGRA